MTGVFISFKACRDGVKRVKNKISNPVCESGEESDLSLVMIEMYLRAFRVH